MRSAAAKLQGAPATSLLAFEKVSFLSSDPSRAPAPLLALPEIALPEIALPDASAGPLLPPPSSQARTPGRDPLDTSLSPRPRMTRVRRLALLSILSSRQRRSGTNRAIHNGAAAVALLVRDATSISSLARAVGGACIPLVPKRLTLSPRVLPSCAADANNRLHHRHHHHQPLSNATTAGHRPTCGARRPKGVGAQRLSPKRCLTSSSSGIPPGPHAQVDAPARPIWRPITALFRPHRNIPCMRKTATASTGSTPQPGHGSSRAFGAPATSGRSWRLRGCTDKRLIARPPHLVAFDGPRLTADRKIGTISV